jgi:hypothetical protein
MHPKHVSRFITAIAIQFMLIILFSLIYYGMINDFKSSIDRQVMEYIDCLSLSTTIQAGIGFSDIMPQTSLAIFCTMIQQMLTIIVSLYIVFTFTL